MAMVTLSPKTMPYKTGNNFNDSSFSSYFNGAEETFILQLTESTNQTLIKPRISTSTNNQHIFLVSNNKKKVEDNEIDVFNAEKYFNEEAGDDGQSPTRIVNNHEKKVENFPVVQLQTRSLTPSVRSQSSSMNSRSALLHNVPRIGQPRKTIKVNRKSFLASLGSHCSCGDKNSVNIDDHIGINSSKKSGKAEKLRFQAASSSKNLGINNNVLEMQGTGGLVLEYEAGRNSLEVFGSPIIRKGKKSINLDRSLNMLAWDAIVPKAEEEIEDSSNDIDSDASSDLFEIQSFSTNPSQYVVGNQAQGSCYAPSEVSVDWSVVTASAADFSAMSDIDDLGPTITRNETLVDHGRKSSGKEIPRRRSSILSGCKSQKAVNVAGSDVYKKISEKSSSERHQKPEFLMPMNRFDKRNGHFSFFDIARMGYTSFA